jgi:hypothetical protein
MKHAAPYLALGCLLLAALAWRAIECLAKKERGP